MGLVLGRRGKIVVLSFFYIVGSSVGGSRNG